MPSNMHKAIRWNKRDPYLESEGSTSQEVEWRIVEPVSAKKTQLASENSENNKSDQLPTEDSARNETDQSPRGLKREGPSNAN